MKKLEICASQFPCPDSDEMCFFLPAGAVGSKRQRSGSLYTFMCVLFLLLYLGHLDYLQSRESNSRSNDEGSFSSLQALHYQSPFSLVASEERFAVNIFGSIRALKHVWFANVLDICLILRVSEDALRRNLTVASSEHTPYPALVSLFSISFRVSSDLLHFTAFRLQPRLSVGIHFQ